MPGLTKRSARDGDARKASSSKSALWMISFGASAAATAFVYPLDSVKTRMQAYREYKGVLDCIRRTYRSEGIRGFYRGCFSPVFTVSVVRSISLSWYKEFYALYAPYFGPDAMARNARKSKYPTMGRTLCIGAAGATSGALMTLIACPFEYAKICAQTSSLMAETKDIGRQGGPNLAADYKNKGAIGVLKTIVSHRGWCGLYTGLGLHTLRDTIGGGAYFMTYELAKSYLANVLPKIPKGDETTVWASFISSLSVMGGGALCGAVTWTLIYPIDTAKSVYQSRSIAVAKGSKVPAAPKIQYFKKNVYAGAGVNVLRSVAVNGVFWLLFEKGRKITDTMG